MKYVVTCLNDFSTKEKVYYIDGTGFKDGQIERIGAELSLIYVSEFKDLWNTGKSIHEDDVDGLNELIDANSDYYIEEYDEDKHGEWEVGCYYQDHEINDDEEEDGSDGKYVIIQVTHVNIEGLNRDDLQEHSRILQEQYLKLIDQMNNEPNETVRSLIVECTSYNIEEYDEDKHGEWLGT